MVESCILCGKKFKSHRSVTQHTQDAHPISILLLDEMLSGNEQKCIQQRKLGFQTLRLPKHLRGKPDHVIINYAKQKTYGLVTRDKKCAKNALNFLSKVISF